MISIIAIVSIILFSILPIVGSYIGFMKVMFDDNNKWQEENKDAYLIFGGK